MSEGGNAIIAHFPVGQEDARSRVHRGNAVRREDWSDRSEDHKPDRQLRFLRFRRSKEEGEPT